MTLSDEIERLDGPSRYMDARIAVALGICQHHRTTRSGYQDDTGFDCDDCGADSWGNRSKDGHNRRLHDPNPAYTASLDAAMTLVPDGWSVSLVRFPEGDAECGVLEFRPDERGKLGHAKDWGDSGRVKAATPALALAAASIRARTEEKGA